MTSKRKVRIGIDVLMTALLLFLMTYQITGQKLHEWLGVGMLLLFLVHNVFNRKWYGSLFKEKYKCIRMIRTAIDLSILMAMLCLGYSGIVMSRYVFAALPVNGPMATARRLHMAAAYWGFVLMSIHLGMHWGQILNTFKRISKDNAILLLGLRLTALVIAGYGLYCFTQNHILSYMFLKSEFVFVDFEKTSISVIIEYMGMMGFWIFIGYEIIKVITRNNLLKPLDRCV